MADFNAGSIEGTLGLDSTPFKAGLDAARADAAKFEGKDIKPTVSADTTEFTAKKDRVQTDLTKLDREKVEPKADLDVTSFLAKYAILQKALNPGGLSGDGKGILGMSLGMSKMTAMIGGVMGLAAAAGPLMGVLAGLGGAAAVAFGGAALSLGLFAKALTSTLGPILKADKAGVVLTGTAGQIQKAVQGLSAEWKGLMASVHPQMLQFLNVALGGLGGILTKLTPLLRTTTVGMTGVVKSILAVAHSNLFVKFLGTLERFMHGFLAGAGPVLANLLKTFMHLFITLQPLMAVVGHGITVAAAAADKFSTSAGLKNFVAYVSSNIPKVVHLVGGVVHALLGLGHGLAPLAGPALGFLAALVHALGTLHIAPLAKGFADVFTALKPLLPVLAELLNVFLKPIGHLLSALAKGPIHDLTHGLRGELQPAFSALRHILHDLVKPLAAFMGSIANLANPTGVKLVTKLLQGLQHGVHALVGPVGKLLVALENVVDDGISAIIPLLPTFGKGLGIVAKALVPVVNGLAAILKHKAVVDVVLALVAAVKGYGLAVAGIALVEGVITGASLGWAGLTVAQDANTASLAANKAAMIAMRIVTIAGTAATGAMTIAQAALTAVMDANPVMLVVIAIAALAAGLVYAYKHSETFRKIVNGAFNAVKTVAESVFHWLSNAVGNVIDFVKSHWKLLLGILTGPIGAALIFLTSHWSSIKNGFSNMIHDVESVVKNGISNVVTWFTQLPGKIVGLVGQMVNAGKALMGGIFHGLESAATAVGGFAANIATAIWHELETVLNNILPHSLSIHVGPIHETIPLFPHLATGGVTTGPMLANVGDNPGGREAVIPLDKYDLPKKGETAALLAAAHRSNARMLELLGEIAGHLSARDHRSMAEAIATALARHGKAQSAEELAALKATLVKAYSEAQVASAARIIELTRKK